MQQSIASDGDFVLAAGIAMEMGIEQAPQVEWKRESDFARYLLLKTGLVCFSCVKGWGEAESTITRTPAVTPAAGSR